MATRVALATGNAGTAGTWGQVQNTPTVHASTNITVSTSAVFSATFTAPNTTNAALGALIQIVNKAASGSPTTITATLQEDLLGTATWLDTLCTSTITLSNAVVNVWSDFYYATGYIYATTGANRYRWKLVCDTGTCTVVANSAGTAFAYQSYDNRNSVPVDTETVYIQSKNATTAVTVTLDGTRAWGTQGLGAGSGSPSGSGHRAVSGGTYISNGGMLSGDTTANHQLTHRGEIICYGGGELRVGTTGSPLGASITSTWIFTDASNGAAGVQIMDTGKVTLQGAAKSSTSLYATTLVSGVGTAASPLVVTDAVDWTVGDEILVAPTTNSATNYNETESRFIITKNSATSYVLSTTAGGSEAAFTNTHSAGARVANVQRNIIFKGTNSSTGAHFHCPNHTATDEVDVDWVRFENIGGALFFGVAPLSFVGFGGNTHCDYSVIYNHQALGFLVGSAAGGSTSANTFTGLIAYSTVYQSGATQNNGSFYIGSSSNKSLVDCYAFGNAYGNFNIASSYSNTLTRCYSFGANNQNITNHAGFMLGSSGVNTINDSEVHASRTYGVVLNTAAGNTFNGLLSGTKGENKTADVFGVSSTFNTALFNDSTFGSPTFISNYQSQAAGSEIRFNRLSDTDNNHRWYTIYGYGQTEETVIRSPGLSVKLNPQDLTTGFTWQFQIPVLANSLARFAGYFLKNSNLGTGVSTISMYLPGNPVSGGVPDATATLDNTTGSTFNDTDEQPVDISANYTGDIPGAAEVVVNVKSTTASAALYCDDFFNAGDRITTFDEVTGLNLWVDGKPLSVISPTVPSAADTAAAVWAYQTANMVTPDSAGTTLIDAADNSELASIK